MNVPQSIKTASQIVDAQERQTQIDETVFLASLGERVRSIRSIRGMSRKVLARASGISERYIAQLESGRGNVSIILLRRVSAAMGARLEDLIPGSSGGNDWSVIRDMLGQSSLEKIAQVKRVLSAKSSDEMMPAFRVALIGLRGAGKSTLGRIAAEKLGWSFVELNREIEQKNGLSIAEIFALYGQEGFRRLEQATLRDLVARPGSMILATGGGIVAEALTFDLVLSSYFTIWLRARPEEHMQRVRQQGDLRPMEDDRSAMQELRTILQSREPLYAQASGQIDTADQLIEDSAEALVDLIRLHTDPKHLRT
jgi:XRE family transcriptional regulator, aerobic/anaerobic benzoate catabolism transcriptional regulator